MVRTTLVALALLAIPAPAFAEVEKMDSGNGLLANCTSQGGSGPAWLCFGFVNGVVSADRLQQDMGSPNAYLCPMPGVTYGQQIDVVVAYLRAHPETRHYDAASLVLSSLQSAFCKK